MRPVAAPALALASLGVMLTALAVGAFAYFVLDFSWLEGLLLGAIVSSTDTAAVFSILRSRSTRLKEPIEPLLELEIGQQRPDRSFLDDLVHQPAQPAWSLSGKPGAVLPSAVRLGSL